MDKYKFGNLVYLKRKEKNLTQEELGKILGVTNKAVSKWETGETLPDLNLIEPIANALDVSINELVTSNPDKVVTRDSKRFIVISIIFMFISLILLIIILLGLSKNDKNTSLNISLKGECLDLFSITPAKKIEDDNSKIKLIGNIKLIDESYEMENVKLIVKYQIDYKYTNTSDESITISYFEDDLIIDVTSKDFDFEIFEEPINEIADFKTFNSISFKADYSFEGNLIGSDNN